jgi:Arc/MetJ family transcription regulator
LTLTSLISLLVILDIIWVAAMSRTIIDIDDSALEAAMRELGTKTKVATVNKALADVGERAQRLAFLDHLAAAEDDLTDPAVMEDAWR